MKTSMMIRACVGSVTAAILGLAGVSHASVPGTLTQQGRLYDDKNAAVGGDLSVTFAIFAQPQGGNAIWTETDTVAFDDGYFSVELGQTTAFGPNVFDGSTRYLEITIGTQPMSPRAAVGSVPYALLAGDVNGDIHPASVTVNGNTVIDSTGKWVGAPVNGATGPAGPIGATGAAGADGPVGPTGAIGTTGPQGPAGAGGQQGPPGPTGAVGSPGPTGPMGSVGPTGPQGTTGAAGPQGAVGPQGATGANGPTGAAGSVGTAGPTGAAGPAGPQGTAGAVGPTGATGANGAVGLTGAAGPPGPTGPTGAPGSIGVAGPTGPAGTAGVAGPTGAVGPAGPQGTPGAVGPIGATGTNGAVGPTGAAGVNGAVGPTGPTGATGPVGTAGSVGPTGPAGSSGAMGPQGPAGATGVTGPSAWAVPTPNCPFSYAQVGSGTPVVCANNNGAGSDTMVRVGFGANVFWIDKFEAVLVDNSNNLVADASFLGAAFPQNGQWPGTTPLYHAESRSGVTPTVNITWFQAVEACNASGKRLPTGTEWLKAARGTIDPGSNNGLTNAQCNTCAGGGSCGGGGPRAAGLGTACVSSWGTQDMIGNLWELTDEWYAGTDNATNLTPWPDAAYGGDGTWGITSRAYNNVGWAPVPAVGARGGDWQDGTRGGVFAMYVGNAPSGMGINTGFRCVLLH